MAPAKTQRRRWLVASVGAGLPKWPAWAQHATSAKPLPQDLQHLVPWGKGTMRFLGFHVYDARLWAEPDFQPQQFARSALALELTYARPFSAADIASRSLQEMKRVGEFDAAQGDRWLSNLQSALPDVKVGDALLGMHRPGKGAEFRRAGVVTGQVADAEFSRLFFGIWLSARTSAPELRQALLAKPPAAGS
jgi:Chalcone isomerase-like